MKMKSIVSLEKELDDVITASENDVKNNQWINRFYKLQLTCDPVT